VDEDGHSPLQMASRNKNSISLLSCLRVMNQAGTTVLDMNYRNREDFNTLHYVLTNYEGAQLHETKRQIATQLRDIIDAYGGIFDKKNTFYRSLFIKRSLDQYLFDAAHQSLADHGVDLTVNESTQSTPMGGPQFKFFVDTTSTTTS